MSENQLPGGLSSGVMYRAESPAKDGVLLAGEQFLLKFEEHQGYFDKKPWPMVSFLIFRSNGNHVRYYNMGGSENSPKSSILFPGSAEDLKEAFEGVWALPDSQWALAKSKGHQQAIRDLTEKYNLQEAPLTITPEFFEDFATKVAEDLVNYRLIDPNQFDQVIERVTRRLRFQHHLQATWKEGDEETLARFRMDL